MRRVRCIETGVMYDSASHAARAMGVTPAMIHHVLKGRQRTAAGHTWEYAPGKAFHRNIMKRKRVKRIIRDNSGAVYESIASLASFKGIPADRARYLLNQSPDYVFDDAWLPTARGERYILRSRSEAPRHVPVNRSYTGLDRFNPVAVYLSRSGWVFEPYTADLFASIEAFKR